MPNTSLNIRKKADITKENGKKQYPIILIPDFKKLIL